MLIYDDIIAPLDKQIMSFIGLGATDRYCCGWISWTQVVAMIWILSPKNPNLVMFFRHIF